MDDSWRWVIRALIREHAALLRAAGTGLVRDAEQAAWRSPAADRMRAEMNSCAQWLAWCASRYDDVADQLTRPSGGPSRGPVRW